MNLVLDHDEEKILVWSNHDFLSFTSNSEKGQIVEWIDISDNRSGFCHDYKGRGCVFSRIKKAPDGGASTVAQRGSAGNARMDPIASAMGIIETPSLRA